MSALPVTEARLEYLVIIGGDRPGIHHTWPTLCCGHSSPPLPVVIQCLSSSEAKMVDEQLQSILHPAPHNPHSIVVGNRIGIHRTKESAISALRGFLFPCWGETSMFRDALAFMIAKGIDDLLSEVQGYKGSGPNMVWAGDVKPSPIIYSYVRNLHGVIESRFYQSDCVPPPKPAAEVLGVHTLKYLQAHGYVQSAVASIVELYLTSHTEQDFALALARLGLPLAEGFFLWYLFNL
ncbi:hypothetical protein F5J12DRAFT_927066 [Pisolithus orientalis]|uniref:uncharacterized protein n=1 Tax=Pisolithus orientalis TaxID=936130 RepID=UPI002225AB4E|nr:uncharacterized protein F5J12DRAFT_927066 [Pisolithus orientalis]KAI6008921.1 hypothetical protein F5J12DRAFT_927066 [Pisolithus orientalis]